MAANNYFGFTTGGTQYGAAPAATYPATQAAAAAGYAVQHAAQSYAAAPRTNQTGYETYQATGHTTTTYPYASRQQTTYEKAQTYYPQAAQVSYSTTDTSHYQAVAKPSYTANTAGYTAARQTSGPKTQTPAPQSGTASYMYASGAAGASTTNYSTSYNTMGSSNYSNRATSMYVQQQQAGGTTLTTNTGMTAVTGVASAVQATGPSVMTASKPQTNSWTPYKKGILKPQKPKQPPKPQQLHYCEVCKISCAGPQTYKEHLEGQKHKKKEAALKGGNNNQNARGGTSLRCELCDVTCTGADAYAAHIRGAKHQKVVKLHTKLGKPIPSTDPVVISNVTNSPVENSTGNKTGNSGAKSPLSGKPGTPATKKTVITPKINFVGGTKLNTTSAKPDDKIEEGKEEKTDLSKLEDKPEIQPVGQDYIEEIRNEEGKVISFQCKLCECRFNDPNAKEMHMKGRRHRLQYKKKVNPDLVVDIKPSLRQRKLQEERLRRQQLREEFWKRREEERWREEMRMMEEEERLYWEERRRFEEEMEYYEWHRRYGNPRMMPPLPPPPRQYMGPPPSQGGPPMAPPVRRPDSVDDRHVLAKHTQIYPKEEELNAVQKIVTNTEKALKFVSDLLTDGEPIPSEQHKKGSGDTTKESNDKDKDKDKEKDKDKDKEKEEEEGQQQPQRLLKGVMRVGVLAKGLLLTGDLSVQLVVMCSEKPTRTLLDRVVEALPVQMQAVAPDDKYEVKKCIEEAGLVIISQTEPKAYVHVTLTSPVMRDDMPGEGIAPAESVKDPPDVLDRQKCLEALAALRHAKWFQARASSLQSCVMVIRILRDLCQRVPTWSCLNTWAMELLVEKTISSSGQPLSPGDALRRVFEAVSSGILLPAGPGLLDPCEKDPLDATASLTLQEREDITASAQHALRLIAFRQIHKVLGMDPLPAPKFTRGQFPRKRRRDNSASEGNDAEGADGKKDKKEDVDGKPEVMETSETAEKA